MPGGRARLPPLGRALAAALGVLVLSACVRTEPADDNYGYGWSYDEAAPSGLRLRYDAGVAAEDRAPLAVFDAAYGETEACVAAAAPGPLVVVVPRGTLEASGATPPPGAHLGGLYYFDTGLVVVTDSLYALRHEMVHYLLDRSGLDVERNRAHDHPAFEACSGPTYR